MKLHGAEIVDTFAEAFPMWGSRVVITSTLRSRSQSASFSICVDLPTPSSPSKVMNLPRTLATVRFNHKEQL